MNVFNPPLASVLNEELTSALTSYRAQRRFDAERWVQAKARMLNEYMRNAKLKAVVVAVSGGVDSAVVLSLVHFASLLEGSPIEKIVPINLPALNNVGATNQRETYIKADTLCRNLGLEILCIDVSPIQNQIISLAEQQLNLTADNWARGQTVAYARTPILYSITSVLSANNLPSIIAGTTNRDEGAYLGYVGKASDGMVDVQLISDLHKSEVYAVAAYLDVPLLIREAVCTGDMYDGRDDEQVFGAPYDFVELYLWYLNHDKKEEFTQSLKNPEIFHSYASNLETLHSYNAHKYLVGSPAVHLDIYESDVLGGWQIHKKIQHERTGNFNTLTDIYLESSNIHAKSAQTIDIEIATLVKIPDFFEEDILENITAQIDKAKLYSIDPLGGQNVEEDYSSKSTRMNVWSPPLSELIWNTLKNSIEPLEFIGDKRYCEGTGYYRPVGVNPYIKINRYTSGGVLLPHYDGAYEYDTKHKNMKTVVIYLDNNSAETRILDDNQRHLSQSVRSQADWTHSNVEVLAAMASQKNTAFIFDNKLLHDSTRVTSGQKTIILTEIIYEKL